MNAIQRVTEKVCAIVFSALVITCLVGLIAAAARCQDKTFIGGGASVIRSSNYDPTPEKQKDGGSTFVGAYAEAGLKLPLNFQARLLAEYSRTPQLQTIFTTDEGSRKAIGEFRIRPELRYHFNPESIIRPFIAGGVDYFKQRFAEIRDPEPIPGPLPAYIEEEYEHGSEPSSGFNPFLTFGAAIGQSHEASFTRLFEDYTNLNPSKLSGYRGNYTYVRPLYRSFNLKAGVEVDYLRFRETNGYGYVDPYYERDTAIKGRIGIVFGGAR